MTNEDFYKRVGCVVFAILFFIGLGLFGLYLLGDFIVSTMMLE